MSLPIPQHSHYRSTASLDKNSFLIPQKFSRRPTSFTSPIISTLVVLAFVGWPSFFVQLTMAVAPRPVGGFAICQTTSSLHIQGGVTYSDDGTYLTTTNQHFRLDLSKGFSLSGASNPPVWVNMTTHYSPFQRFHAGACTPDSATFLTVGNADSVNTGASGGGFMMAYSVTKGTWIAVTQAVSEATGSNNNGSGRRYDQTGAGAGIVGAGRTMPGFALATTTNNKAITGQGVVIGGGWISQKGSTHSALATELTNLVTEADLVTIGSDGSVESLTWSVVPKAGNGGYNVNRNLGSLAGAKVVILPSSGKAVVLGGVTGGRSNGLSFSTIPIIDMATGVVILQRTQSSTPNATPQERYGHCVALSADGNTIYVFGGSLVSNDMLTNNFFALDIRTWTWLQPTVKTSLASPPPVRDHQCVIIGNQFLSLFGFNTNGVPDSGSSARATPPIYVLSTSQWEWSAQYTPLPGTPAPPTPPDVPTDDKKSKINGVGIAFGVIFGLAFLGVIGYMIFSHKRKQRRKAERLKLIELEEQKKEEVRLEKERLEKMRDAPLPPTPPMMAHVYNNDNNNNNNNSNYQGQGQGYDYNTNMHTNKNGGAYYQSPPPPQMSGAPSTNYYQAQDPFQNTTYQHYQPQYQQQQQIQPPLTSNSYYPQTGDVYDRAQFNHPSSSGPSSAFIPEEMGSRSSAMDANYVGGYPGHHQTANYKMSLESEGGTRLPPGPSYR